MNFKLLEAARRWREQNAAKQQDTVGVDRDVEAHDDAGGGGEEYPSVAEQLRDEAAYRAAKRAETRGGEDSDTDLSESSAGSDSDEEEAAGRRKGAGASDSDED